MKLTGYYVFLLLSVTILSCKQPASHLAVAPPKDTTIFYPVNSFLKQQIGNVDATPYYIYIIRIIDQKRDSATVSKKQFDSLAAPFIACNISDSSLKKFYTESLFDDQTTRSYTFSYRTTDSNMTVQSIDVLLNRENQQVKRVFMNTFQNFGDSSITLKMGWKTDRNFYINRIVQYKNGKEQITQNRVVWDDRD
jgi:hypothetical protein